MTNLVFGQIDENDGMNIEGAVILEEFATGTADDGPHPLIALQLYGRINQGKPGDTMRVMLLMSTVDAGSLAQALEDTAARHGPFGAAEFRTGRRASKARAALFRRRKPADTGTVEP